jgi:hypothetical protein
MNENNYEDMSKKVLNKPYDTIKSELDLEVSSTVRHEAYCLTVLDGKLEPYLTVTFEILERYEHYRATHLNGVCVIEKVA